MKTEQKSQSAILEAALKVFSREELQAMSRPSLTSFLHLIEERLDEPGPQPTVAELEGIKELVLEHLSHPALASLSKPLPTSPTMNSQTSASPSKIVPQSDKPSAETMPPESDAATALQETVDEKADGALRIAKYKHQNEQMRKRR